MNLEQLSKSQFGSNSPTIIAGLYARLNQKDSAMAWLDSALANHDAELPFIKSNPDFTTMRDDPRFQSIVHRMGL